MKLRANLLFIIILFCGFITTNQLLAKTEITSNSYRTDFEDVEEHGQWELNRGPLGSQCANKWSFGQPGANDGLFGLFASSNASTADYVNKGVSVVALRTLTLDAGEYELSFDWRAGGLNDADGLYVCWISESEGSSYFERILRTSKTLLRKGSRIVSRTRKLVVARFVPRLLQLEHGS